MKLCPPPSSSIARRASGYKNQLYSDRPDVAVEISGPEIADCEGDAIRFAYAAWHFFVTGVRASSAHVIGLLGPGKYVMQSLPSRNTRAGGERLREPFFQRI